MIHILSVSTAAFDGYELTTALEEIARLGLTYVEPAFIEGYVSFDESVFSASSAALMARTLKDAGLEPLALSAHIDCGAPDAAERLVRRLGFAARIGARHVITNSTSRQRRGAFLDTVAQVIPTAESHAVALLFENPGHGKDNLIGGAYDAVQLLSEFRSPWVRLNYDIGNVFTYSSESVRPETDLEQALTVAAHYHLKDVRSDPEGWTFSPIGDGSIDYDVVLRRIAAGSPGTPLGIELPLRLARPGRRDPVRAPAPLPLPAIREAIARSVAFVSERLRT